MSEAPLPTAAGSVADPPVRPAAWLWPAVVAIAFSPFVLTAVGLAAAVLRHPARPAAPPAVAMAEVEIVTPEPVAPAAEPEPIEPGEARPPIPGLSPSAAEPAPAAAPAPEPVPVAAVRGPKCEKYGTAVNFVRSPALACDRAARDQKLAMILHVAGHFDDPGFT
jgi:hypothetical protein